MISPLHFNLYVGLKYVSLRDSLSYNYFLLPHVLENKNKFKIE